MNAVFYHGWGFDSAIWTGISELLSAWRMSCVDRGYFGDSRPPLEDGPCLSVTHSFGTMLALREPPPRCIGIVAINGFDRFAANGTSPGIHPRVLKRMTDRFESDPETVLREFRQRCGCDAHFPAIDTQALGKDLRNLAALDCSALDTARNLPILSLQGDADPILHHAMREAVFAQANRVERRTIPDGGHLLPLTEPEECARAIQEFARTLV